MALGQVLHLGRERQAHHDPLGLGGQGLQQRFDVVEAGEGLDLLGAVHYQRLDLAQVEARRPHPRQEVAGGAEQHRGPLGEHPGRPQRGDLVAGGLGQAAQGLGQAARRLRGGGGYHQAGPVALGCDPVQKGRAVRHQGAGAGTRPGHQVVAPAEHGHGGLLERRGPLDALGGERLHQLFGEPELVEALHQVGSPSPGPPRSPGS